MIETESRNTTKLIRKRGKHIIKNIVKETVSDLQHRTDVIYVVGIINLATKRSMNKQRNTKTP
jgi:hypothetical protein